jgi:hypothetical protein
LLLKSQLPLLLIIVNLFQTQASRISHFDFEGNVREYIFYIEMKYIKMIL